MRPSALLTAFLLAVHAPLAAPVPKVKSKRPDAEAFVGAWEAVSPAHDGQILGKALWTFDDKLGLRIEYPEEGGRYTSWAVALAPEDTPKGFDLGGFKGIYEFDGDDIRVAYTAGDRRPPDFDLKDGVYVRTLRRVEPKQDK
jgi:uncharacterized protein (TIGR03067 family)